MYWLVDLLSSKPPPIFLLLLTLSRLCFVKMLFPSLDFACDFTDPCDFLDPGFIKLTLRDALDFFIETLSSYLGEGLIIILVPKVSVFSLLLIEDFFDFEYFEADFSGFTGSSKELYLNVGPLFIIYNSQHQLQL